MSKKIESISERRRKKKPLSMKESAQEASQHIRNTVPKDLKEPKGFASGGDMRKILEEPQDDDRNDEAE